MEVTYKWESTSVKYISIRHGKTIGWYRIRLPKTEEEHVNFYYYPVGAQYSMDEAWEYCVSCVDELLAERMKQKAPTTITVSNHPHSVVNVTITPTPPSILTPDFKDKDIRKKLHYSRKGRHLFTREDTNVVKTGDIRLVKFIFANSLYIDSERVISKISKYRPVLIVQSAKPTTETVLVVPSTSGNSDLMQHNEKYLEYTQSVLRVSRVLAKDLNMNAESDFHFIFESMQPYPIKYLGRKIGELPSELWMPYVMDLFGIKEEV